MGKASKEGQGPSGAVKPMMMMVIKIISQPGIIFVIQFIY